MAEQHPLLRPPSAEEAARYHEQLVARHPPRPPPVEVRADAGGGKGKGLFATRDIEEGELIFAERPLAGVQHAENKAVMPACPQCFRPIVRPEQCVAHILCTTIGRLSGGGGGGGGGSGDDSCSEGGEEVDPLEAARRVQLIEAAVDAPMLEGLINGTRALPRSERLATPEPVPCPGGCDERFCSPECAAAAWRQHHCLLCPVGESDGVAGGSGSVGKGKGKGKAPVPAMRGKLAGAARNTGGAGGSGSGARGRERVEAVCGVRLRRARLAAFLEHADESNDMLRLAAQVLARTLVVAWDELGALKEAAEAAAVAGPQAAVAAGGGSGSGGEGEEQSSAAGEAAAATDSGASGGGQSAEEALRAEALRRAWLRFAVAEKAPWWEVAAAEEGEDGEELRAQLRELAADSLRLLRAAWAEVPWPELLDLQVYGSIIGMFEQNNLGTRIPSPAEAYFSLTSDEAALPDAAERAALEAELEPLRLALGDDLAAASIEGTAFYALHSCCNHSCAPNAAAEGDVSGEVHIVAAKAVAAGEEVVLSYIEEQGAGLAERRRALSEYGFECRCARCEAEAAAAAADKRGEGEGEEEVAAAAPV